MTEKDARPQGGSTTESGAPAPSDKNSLTIGDTGPILLHDHHFINQMAHFNRERIPERNVHAKGSGAFGVFETTEDVSQWTKAALFQPGVRTDMLARFSTVAGEQGSPDTWRDPRGFALKFYTTEGNWDLVGNNTPVFFIRDTMKFPHFIRSQKRRGGTGLRDNDMQWDFWTLNPESAHQVTWLMGDRGLPASWREMNGYGSHTYMWVNAAGEKSWVKFHFKSDQGVKCLTQEAANTIAGEDSDFHRRDLQDAIADGDFPSWTLHVQVMPYDEAKTYRYNPFDLTKVWPHSDYPLIKVGTMTLNRNPDNFFAQIEQAAFEPSAIVPGIGFSPDKMLLGRVFAYADTHRHRIGANYHQLPVNRNRVEDAEHLHLRRPDGLRALRRRTGLRPELLRARLRRRDGSGRGRLGDRRRDGARGVLPASRRRRLRPGRHAGARGDGRRGPRAVRRQRRRPHPRRREAADPPPGLRLLEERRPGDRQAHRGGRARGPRREGPGARPDRALRGGGLPQLRLIPAPASTTTARHPRATGPSSSPETQGSTPPGAGHSPPSATIAG